MVEMSERNFTIKVREATVQVCRAALAQTDFPENPDKVILTRSLKGRIRTPGNLRLCMGEAIVLREIVEDCARESFREGSDLHNEAVMFAAALDDRVITGYNNSVSVAAAKAQAEKDEEANELSQSAVDEINFGARADKRRDNIFRDMVSGGSHKRLNIWGQVVEDGVMDKTAGRRKAKTMSPEDWRKAAELDRLDRERERKLITNKMGAAMQYESSVRIPLNGGKPVADTEADRILTTGSTMDYNDDMKRVGTLELISQGHMVRPKVRVADGVVGTVSSFASKPR